MGGICGCREGGDGCRLRAICCGLGDDGRDDVAVALFVEGDEPASGVPAGCKGWEAIEAAICVRASLDVFIGDGCGAGELARLVAEGEDGVLEVLAFLAGVVAFGRRCCGPHPFR